MARGRMISGTIGESRKFAALSSDTHRLMYLMVLPHVDREGRFEADPVLIRGRCLTRLEVDSSMVQAWLDDAADVGLIKLYEADGLPVLEVVDFLEHNTPHHKEPESKLPGPGGGTPFRTQQSKHGSSMAQASANDESTLPIIELKRIELKEKEREDTRQPDSELAASKPQAGLVPQAARANRSITKDEAESFLSAWNDNRGQLPACQVLTDKRRKGIARFLKDVPGDADGLAVFRAAVQEVARDSFWIERKYGLDNLLVQGRVVEKAEKREAGPTVGRNVVEASQRASTAAELIRQRRERQGVK